jgi:hypothetical protein
MTRLFRAVGLVIVLIACTASALLPTSAHATATRSHALRRCAFRSHEWGVVQDTSRIIQYSDITTHADQQSAVAHLEERFFRVERRYGSPYGSGALFSDLASAWALAESASYDQDQFLLAISDGTLDDQDYWVNQGNSDTAQAWAVLANAWGDVKATC